MVRRINFCCHSSPRLSTTDGSWRCCPSWPWFFPCCCLILVLGHSIHILWLQQVAVAEAYIMEDGAAGDDLWDKEDVHLQGLQKDGPPPGLQNTKTPLNDHPGLRQPAVECHLHLVAEGLSVRCHEGNGLGETGVATIPYDSVSEWRVLPLIIERAVPKHACIMHRACKPHTDVYVFCRMVTNGLKLYRIDSFLLM